MTHWSRVAMVGLLALTLGLTACAEARATYEGDEGVTWEEAKETAQAMELTVSKLVPSQDVVSIVQNEKGGLFSCDGSQHRWKGITTVTLTPGTDIDSLLKALETQLRTALTERGDFTVTHRRDFFDDYAVTARVPATGEAILLGRGEPGTIVIDSWSVCFTLPEAVYPGGDF